MWDILTFLSLPFQCHLLASTAILVLIFKDFRLVAEMPPPNFVAPEYMKNKRFVVSNIALNHLAPR